MPQNIHHPDRNVSQKKLYRKCFFLSVLFPSIRSSRIDRLHGSISSLMQAKEEQSSVVVTLLLLEVEPCSLLLGGLLIRCFYSM